MVDEQTGYDDEQDRVDREDEQIREQRWAEFVKEMRQSLHDGWTLESVLSYVCRSIRSYDQPIDPTPLERWIANFAEFEGWDGVLNAIARAYREEQDEKKNGANNG